MSIVPVKVRWPLQLLDTEDSSFVIETKALSNTTAIFQPVFRFHNFSTVAGSLELEIDYKFDLGSGSDPLNDGTFELNVVNETVNNGEFYDYAFGGIQLDSDTADAITHTVTVTNNSGVTQICQALLFGRTEIAVQLPASQSIIKGTS